VDDPFPLTPTLSLGETAPPAKPRSFLVEVHGPMRVEKRPSANERSPSPLIPLPIGWGEGKHTALASCCSYGA